MTNNKSIEGIIEDRLIELFKHSGDVPAPFRYIPKTRIGKIAKSIVSDINNQWDIVASGKLEFGCDQLEDIFSRFFGDKTLDEYQEVFEKIEKFDKQKIQIGIRKI